MVNDLERQFGIRVRAARERAGLTQEELAARVGRHVDTISLIERGRTLPALKSAYTLAEVLEVPIAALMPELEDTRSPKRQQLEVEMTEIIRSLPDNMLELARDQLASLARHK